MTDGATPEGYLARDRYLCHSTESIMRRRLTEAFGIQYPVVCAPMAFVTGGRLAAAVSAAGGLGILGGGTVESSAVNPT